MRQVLKSKLHFMGDYVITDNFCFFNFSDGNKYTKVYYSRKAKSMLYGNMLLGSNNNIYKQVLFNGPLNYDAENDVFITAKNPHSFMKIKEVLTDKSFYKGLDKKKAKILIENFNKITSTDNPVIVNFRFKDF